MSFLDAVKSAFTDALNEAKSELSRYNNAKFLDSLMAGCVLLAAADGDIEPSEKQKALKFVQSNETLKVFDTAAVIKAFNKYAENYEFDAGVGEETALNAVKTVTDETQKRLLVRVCVAVGKANGSFEPCEQDMVRKICGVLGLNASEFI